MGVAVVSVFYGVVKCMPGHEEFREAVTQFSWRNLDSLDISSTTKHTVMPILAGLCTIIILPALLTLGVIVLFSKCCQKEKERYVFTQLFDRCG